MGQLRYKIMFTEDINFISVNSSKDPGMECTESGTRMEI